MKTNKLCSSLELSKKLEKNGFPQEDSAFYWGRPKREDTVWVLVTKVGDGHKDWNYIAAPTADEILEELPELIITKNNPDFIYVQWINKIDGLYKIGYQRKKDNESPYFKSSDSLVSALGLMFNYLKEKEIV